MIIIKIISWSISYLFISLSLELIPNQCFDNSSVSRFFFNRVICIYIYLCNCVVKNSLFIRRHVIDLSFKKMHVAYRQLYVYYLKRHAIDMETTYSLLVVKFIFFLLWTNVKKEETEQWLRKRSSSGRSRKAPPKRRRRRRHRPVRGSRFRRRTRAASGGSSWTLAGRRSQRRLRWTSRSRRLRRPRSSKSSTRSSPAKASLILKSSSLSLLSRWPFLTVCTSSFSAWSPRKCREKKKKNSSAVMQFDQILQIILLFVSVIRFSSVFEWMYGIQMKKLLFSFIFCLVTEKMEREKEKLVGSDAFWSDTANHILSVFNFSFS